MTAIFISIIILCLWAEAAEWKNNHKDPKWRK